MEGGDGGAKPSVPDEESLGLIDAGEGASVAVRTDGVRVGESRWSESRWSESRWTGV
jgi:hypothetical protein